MAAPDDPMLARLRRVRAEIDAAAIAAGRQASDVRLLLATKTQPADRIITALTAGYRLIGENRVQEVVAKAEELSPFSPETHFIGHLQANKINQLVHHISCLQTLDTVDLARKLNTRLEARERRLDVLIQVNVSGETAKSGVAPERALDLLDAVSAFPRLTVRGFMTIGLNSPDGAAVRAGYRALASLRDAAIAEQIPGAENATELSMGMSGDFADAIAEGATIVRLGFAIFGQRPPAG
jgi:pyridoxal phosphate enzyme (YggS family)